MEQVMIVCDPERRERNDDTVGCHEEWRGGRVTGGEQACVEGKTDMTETKTG